MLNAAGSKWNFLPFRPGLVGGHCIGVDPYYLTHKAQEIGYHPEMILAGRRLNDNMALYVAGQITQLMAARRIHVKGARVLMLGITFKENCPDIRNSKVVDVVRELREAGRARRHLRPLGERPPTAGTSTGCAPCRALRAGRYDAVVVAVAHRAVPRARRARRARACAAGSTCSTTSSSVFPASAVDGRL